MAFAVGLTIGLFVGTFAGLLVMGLLVAASTRGGR